MKKEDLLKHELVPSHEVLSEEELKKLLRIYNIEKERLSRILITDPIVKAIDAKDGDVIKIVRQTSETAGKSVSYRLISKAVL